MWLLEECEIGTEDIDTVENWHLQPKSFVLPTGESINFNVGIQNALPSIVKAFIADYDPEMH